MKWWQRQKQGEEKLTALVYVGLNHKWQVSFRPHTIALMIFLLVAMVGWSIFSFSAASIYYVRGNTEREKLRHLKTQIFNYQVEHENVFEDTYEPEKSERPNVAKNAQDLPE